MTDSSGRDRHWFITFLLGIWRVLDGFRRGVHLVLMLVLALVLVALLTPSTPTVPDGAALRLELSGRLVDQLSGDPLERALARAQGRPAQETLLRDAVNALERAADDRRITALVLDLDHFTGGGLSKQQELAEALRAFREAGKPVIAYGDGFTQAQYYLAAHADELYMHPQGSVLLEGFGLYRTYFREALDTLLVDTNVVRVGEYKTFAEPFMRDDMSDEDREMSQAYLHALWQAWREDVAVARGLDSRETLQRYVDEYVDRMEAADGSLARVALDAGLVDALQPRDVLQERMRELARPDGESTGYRQLGHREYLGSLRTRDRGRRDGPAVAVVVASGEILPGEQPPGAIGGDSTAALIRRAREDDDVAALVLRVDSGGGSALASDVILRELELFQQTGRPLVVSMGSVAASGGYWISMSADEIWASPSTITGSIGVVGLFPTFQRSLERLGVHVDGVGTTWLAGQLRLDRELSDDARRLLELSVADLYAQFTGKVAEYRGMSPEEVDAIGRGRVFSGGEALEVGLVDELGELDEAIEAAARRAELAEGSWRVRWIEPEPGLLQRVLIQSARVSEPLLASAAPLLRAEPGRLYALLDAAERQLRTMSAFGDPRGVAAYCFCEPD